MADLEQLDRLIRNYRRLQEADGEDLRRQLQEYRSRLTVLEAKASLLPDAPALPVTVPVIFNRAYDENFISDYLAYVLDPRRNGIGEEPLARLLALVDPDLAMDFDEVEVYREYTLEGGRIDLLIRIDQEVLVGIENKIYAGEGNQQTLYYERAMRNAFPDDQQYYFYLTPGKTQASSKAFYPLSYRELLHTFRKVAFDWKADIQKSVLWDDFLTHLEAYIVMEQNFTDFSEKAKLYVEHYSLIKDLEKNFRQDWERLIGYLTSRFQQRYAASSWVVDFSSSPSRFYHQVYQKSWAVKDCWIHYEFFFSPDRLISNQFQLMVDVEGGKAGRVISQFDNRYPGFAAEYEARGMQYRPRQRKIAIAWKDYELEGMELTRIGDSFLSAMDEFSFLTPVIDEVVAEYQNDLLAEQGEVKWNGAGDEVDATLDEQTG